MLLRDRHVGVAQKRADLIHVDARLGQGHPKRVPPRVVQRKVSDPRFLAGRIPDVINVFLVDAAGVRVDENIGREVLAGGLDGESCPLCERHGFLTALLNDLPDLPAVRARRERSGNDDAVPLDICFTQCAGFRETLQPVANKNA